MTQQLPLPLAAPEAATPDPILEAPPASREQLRSRRHRPVRARTVSVKRMTKRELELGRELYPPDEVFDVARPKTRADCKGVPRPCPFVSCVHHLYLDVSARTGAIKLNFPDLDPWELPARESCALDVADRNGTTLEGVGRIMNLTRERIRQVEVRAIAKLQAADEALALRDFHGELPKLSPSALTSGKGKRRLPVVQQRERDEDFDADEFASTELDE